MLYEIRDRIYAFFLGDTVGDEFRLFDCGDMLCTSNLVEDLRRNCLRGL